MSKSKGRPRKFVDQTSGQPIEPGDTKSVPIVGLSLHRLTKKKSVNLEYYTLDAEGNRIRFGTDFAQAKLRFYRWLSQGRTVIFPGQEPIPPREDGTEPLPPAPHGEDSDEDPPLSLAEAEADQHASQFHQFIPEAELWEMIRKLFWAEGGRVLFAKRLNCPALMHLDRLAAPEPSLTLEAIGEMYLNRQSKPLHERWKRDCKTYWDEFCRLTEARTVADLTAEAVKAYRDRVYADRLTKKAAPRYVNNRFDAIRVVFGYVPKEAGGQDAENLTRADKLLEMLQRLDSDEENPRPIKPQHFKRLLEAADVKWRAILLLALNAGLYPIDVAQIEKAHIDLRRKTLTNFRTKTRRGKHKSYRVAVLWDRTIKAIRDYWEQEPHTAATVFVSHNGTPYQVKTLQNHYREKLRVPCKLTEEEAAFNTIRDGAASAAGNTPGVDPVHVDMLLGHRVATRDRYWHKKPELVARACAGIETHYFRENRV